MVRAASRSILVINPNTTVAMTDGLKPLINSLGYETATYTYFTAPSGVPSINNEDDAAVSAKSCLPELRSKLSDYDAFLVCCYSQHPLVPALRKELQSAGLNNKPVTGIFEASLATCIQALNVDHKFGIVSTGSQWSEILDEAVANLLGTKSSSRYAGTETTGLNANELHSTPKNDVDKRMKDAVHCLLEKGAKAICLGCAGMAGMDETVRAACVEHLGEYEGEQIKIIDGVVAGAIHLEGALRANKSIV